MLDPALIRSKLDGLAGRSVEDDAMAAVLISLVRRDGQMHFVLTRRTETVATHKGQISFPGGVREGGDSDLRMTALRETEEEIGVNPEAVDVLGEFHDYDAVTGLKVRSVVGLLDSRVGYLPQQDEVAYVLEVPCSFFQETPPRVEHRLVRGRLLEVYFWDYRGELIWGLTARMIKDFVDFVITSGTAGTEPEP